MRFNSAFKGLISLRSIAAVGYNHITYINTIRVLMSYHLVITTSNLQRNKIEQPHSKRIGNNAHLIYLFNDESILYKQRIAIVPMIVFIAGSMNLRNLIFLKKKINSWTRCLQFLCTTYISVNLFHKKINQITTTKTFLTRSSPYFSIKVISNPITRLDRPWGFQEVKATRFHDNRHTNVVRLSALGTGRLYPPENIPGTHFF
jgi:hypothetical protein